VLFPVIHDQLGERTREDAVESTILIDVLDRFLPIDDVGVIFEMNGDSLDKCELHRAESLVFLVDFGQGFPGVFGICGSVFPIAKLEEIVDVIGEIIA
jgi:hypothetical protein